jgi:hypothetical protein
MEIQEANGGGWIFTQDETTMFVPNDPKNRHCAEIQELIANGHEVLPADPPPDTTLDDVDNEAQRRIFALIPGRKRDRESLMIRQINITARGSELSRLEQLETITPTEAGELAAILGLFAKVKAIRTYSNLLGVDHGNGEEINIEAGTSASHPEGWPF